MEEIQISHVLWFECDRWPIGSGVWIPGSQLVVLFWKVVEPVGGGAWLEEVSHWGGT